MTAFHFRGVTPLLDQPNKKLGRKKKLSDENRETIKALLLENCSITLAAIQDYLAQSASVTTSAPTICREIIDFGYTLKRISLLSNT
jgi:transposase